MRIHGSEKERERVSEGERPNFRQCANCRSFFASAPMMLYSRAEVHWTEERENHCYKGTIERLSFAQVIGHLFTRTCLLGDD